MSTTEEGNIFQRVIFSKEVWNSKIKDIYPSFEVRDIKNFDNLKVALEEIQKILNDLKVILNNSAFTTHIKRSLINENRKFIIKGNNERGDLEIKVFVPDYKFEEFKAFLVYKCPLYYRYAQETSTEKLAVDGLFLELKTDNNENYYYEIRLIEAKLSETIWPSYLAQVLIYWINLKKFLQDNNLGNFFKLKKEVLFILGKKSAGGNFEINPYIFPFEDAVFRLEQLRKIYHENFKSFEGKEVTPPIKPLCFQGEKCPYLDRCFHYIQAEEEYEI